MPIVMNSPGVYVTELPSSQHPIVGVATSITAFVGRAAQGPVDSPRICNTWTDFVRAFGGLWAGSTMSYAVFQFFQNGGGTAIVVRVISGGAVATLTLPSKGGTGVKLQAASPGRWGDSLQATVDHQVSDPSKPWWNLTIVNSATGVTERYLNIRTNISSPKSLPNVLQSSQLVQYVDGADQLPDITPVGPPPQPVTGQQGDDGAQIADADIDPATQIGGLRPEHRRHLQHPLHSTAGDGTRPPVGYVQSCGRTLRQPPRDAHRRPAS